jgi:hypothetical protein
MTKVRLQILVEPEVANLFKKMSLATNESVSSLVAGLLLNLAPGLEQSKKMIELAHKMKSDAQEKVSQHLEKTLKIMEMEVEGNQEKIKGLLQ